MTDEFGDIFPEPEIFPADNTPVPAPLPDDLQVDYGEFFP
jgi:hypothetical protein